MTSARARGQLPRAAWQACMHYITWIHSGAVTILDNSTLQKILLTSLSQAVCLKSSWAPGRGNVSKILFSSSLLSDEMTCLLHCTKETKPLGLLLALFKVL